MKLYSIFLAYHSINNLYKSKMTYCSSHKVMNLREKIKHEANFYVEEEQKLVDNFVAAGKAKVLGTEISFESSRSAEENKKNVQEYIEKRSELQNMDIEWKSAPIKISTNETADLLISAEDIQNLKGFIEFEG